MYVYAQKGECYVEVYMCLHNEPQTGSKPPPEVVSVEQVQFGSTVSAETVELVRFGFDGAMRTGL